MNEMPKCYPYSIWRGYNKLEVYHNEDRLAQLNWINQQLKQSNIWIDDEEDKHLKIKEIIEQIDKELK